MHLLDQLLLFRGEREKRRACAGAAISHSRQKSCLVFFFLKWKRSRGRAVVDLCRRRQSFPRFPQVWFLPRDDPTGLLVMLLLLSPAQTLRSLVCGRCSLSSNVNAPILHRRGSAWRAGEVPPWVQTEATPQTDEITAGFTDELTGLEENEINWLL